MDNALRYAAEGGELVIRVSLEGEQRLFIEFADRGPGFAPEALPRTLDRFWRAESARSQHTAGSGLGLSNRDGGGAIIRITLPTGISAEATG